MNLTIAQNNLIERLEEFGISKNDIIATLKIKYEK